MLESLDTLIAFTLIFTIVSLLITIVVQMITSFFNLRGKNLAWGIAEAFEAIAPELKAEVEGKGKALADHLLKDPLISDSQIGGTVKPASVVRADELFDLMHRIATNKKVATPEIKKNVRTLFKSLGVPDSIFAVADAEKARMEDFKSNLEQAVHGLPAGPAKDAANAALQDAAAKLGTMSTDAAACATRWAAQGEAEIQKIYAKFEHWFETGQERSQEWFTTHARIITVVLGVMFALVLQLDTIQIYKLLSSNREVRDRLVAQSETVLKQAEHVLGETQNVLETGLDNWRAALKPVEKVSDRLKALKVESGDTRGMLVSKAEAALKGADTEEEWLKGLDGAIDTAAQKYLKEKSGDYRSVAESLDKSGFSLFPEKMWKRWDDWPDKWGQHLLGMIFSALLLSLGAPFWFNTLKSLTSLRSTVAKNISEEEEAEQKGIKVEPTSKLPPTVK